jgi:hypothetical protein
LIGALLFIVLTPPLATFASDQLGGVVADIVQGDSFFSRTIGPHRLALKTFEVRPLLGFGLTGDVEMMPYALDVFAPSIKQTNHDTTEQMRRTSGFFAELAEGKIGRLLTNAFWQFWVDYGLLGGVTIATIVLCLLGSMEVEFVGFVSACLSWQTLGWVIWRGRGCLYPSSLPLSECGHPRVRSCGTGANGTLLKNNQPGAARNE